MNWILKDNIIYLQLDNGELYAPTVQELFSQKDNENCSFMGLVCSNPAKDLSLRFSKINLTAICEINYINNKIQLNLFAVKNSNKHLIPLVNGDYSAYIVTGNVCHCIGGQFEILRNILNQYPNGTLSYIQYMKIKRQCIEDEINIIDNLEQQISEIKDTPKDIKDDGLKAKLFPYQSSGFNWMSFMVANGCGCILGDEMGLGKTMQIIALFGNYKRKNQEAHFLVVCPVSLLENWRREIEKFYPSLSTYIHRGSKSTGLYKDLLLYDVIIVSYGNVQTYLSMFNMINWDIVALDEAQNIKNPNANRTRYIKQLKRNIGIAISGTPFENHMTDVWSIVDFIMPSYLGDLSQFQNHFTDDVNSAIELEKLITPIMIRRRVKDVAKDLPERVDIPIAIPMTAVEANYYESERPKNEQEMLEALNSKKLNKIQGLRMFCTHPLVYDHELTERNPIKLSNKYQLLCEILDEIIAQRNKVIIFTSFNEMSRILVEDLANRYGVYINYINGSVESAKRQIVIDEFTDVKGSAILVLNPKAAGAGLNITAANYVIHYTLEWNPAIEDQASARAYRRGQTKTVFVYRLFYANTIEEFINRKIQTKREISDNAIIGNIGDLYSQEELIKALSVSPYNTNDYGIE